MTLPSPRKGATRVSDIPADILKALSCGELQCANLTECLAVDQLVLLHTVFPQLSLQAQQAVEKACQSGIVRRMESIAIILLDELGAEGIYQCQLHQSDTVRGWACFMIGAQRELALAERLSAIRLLADDIHFGVREWAWMAVRPHLVKEPETAVTSLAAWTTSPSERLRRFACESLRPRGVWCAHIPDLKQKPELALPVLTPLRADGSLYVQDSVANWLNDAAKDKPEWVYDLCQKWSEDSPVTATRRICQRAMRNLK